MRQGSASSDRPRATHRILPGVDITRHHHCAFPLARWPKSEAKVGSVDHRSIRPLVYQLHSLDGAGPECSLSRYPRNGARYCAKHPQYPVLLRVSAKNEHSCHCRHVFTFILNNVITLDSVKPVAPNALHFV